MLSPMLANLLLSHRHGTANLARELKFSAMPAKLDQFRFANRQSGPLNVPRIAQLKMRGATSR